ncbi:hypothetical protein [Advenella mimigardefordensis]|uniref:hypothetical protein n=1 Tax=Advenella mimigardefordensis TaxID=302406 RepID=UPI00046D40D0|nr:hypothetical protein [Advenella mimigardefordensis]
MQYIKTLLQKLFTIRSLVGSIVRWIIYLTAFFTGLWAAGPLLTSAVYKEIIAQVSVNPLLGYLLDPGSWILDHLIRNLAPILAIWACAFASYYKFKDRAEDLNIYFGYASLLTNSIGTFLVALSMLFCGIGMYSVLVLHEVPVGIRIVSLALIGFGLPGLFFNYYVKIGFKPSPLLDNVAPYAAVLCGLLSVAAIFYGAIADVLGLIRFLLKHG